LFSHTCHDFPWNKQERELYEYIIAEGTVVHKQNGNLLDTNQGLEGSKWIFVMSTCRKLYAGEVRIILDIRPFN
jgi:hypothetical protein